MAEVERLERALLDPSVRADPGRVAALLHPEFVEFGASGTVWRMRFHQGTLTAP